MFAPIKFHLDLSCNVLVIHEYFGYLRRLGMRIHDSSHVYGRCHSFGFVCTRYTPGRYEIIRAWCARLVVVSKKITNLVVYLGFVCHASECSGRTSNTPSRTLTPRSTLIDSRRIFHLSDPFHDSSSSIECGKAESILPTLQHSPIGYLKAHNHTAVFCEPFRYGLPIISK